MLPIKKWLSEMIKSLSNIMLLLRGRKQRIQYWKQQIKYVSNVGATRPLILRHRSIFSPEVERLSLQVAMKSCCDKSPECKGQTYWRSGRCHRTECTNKRVFIPLPLNPSPQNSVSAPSWWQQFHHSQEMAAYGLPRMSHVIAARFTDMI